MEEFGCIVVSVDPSGREALIDCGNGQVARLSAGQGRFVLRHDAVRGRMSSGGRRPLYNASRDWWFDASVEALPAEVAMA